MLLTKRSSMDSSAGKVDGSIGSLMPRRSWMVLRYWSTFRRRSGATPAETPGGAGVTPPGPAPPGGGVAPPIEGGPAPFVPLPAMFPLHPSASRPAPRRATTRGWDFDVGALGCMAHLQRRLESSSSVLGRPLRTLSKDC